MEQETAPQPILDRIAAIQRLIENESAPDGEKEAAKLALARLLKRYKVDLASLSDDHKEMYWFKYANDLERRLLKQIAYKITGESDVWLPTRKGKRTQLVFNLTKREYIDLTAEYAFYSRVLVNELDDLMYAFFLKHGIFPPNKAKSESEISAEELARYKKAKKLSNLLDDEKFNKPLESGKQRELNDH